MSCAPVLCQSVPSSASPERMLCVKTAAGSANPAQTGPPATILFQRSQSQLQAARHPPTDRSGRAASGGLSYRTGELVDFTAAQLVCLLDVVDRDRLVPEVRSTFCTLPIQPSPGPV